MIIQGIHRNTSKQELISAIQTVFLETTDNIAWLKPGDTVLLKPALNSPNKYPATTHPLSVQAIRDLLVTHGARVVVGDQSGIEHVVHSPKGIIKGSTIENFEKSGIKHPGDSDFIAFENDDWESFNHIETPLTKSWKHGFHITSWIEKADHIINLPRLSAHSQAGVTLGFKNWVGILREDSRMEFHANGPFNSFIRNAARGSGLASIDDGTSTFIEKIVEISLAVKEKLRATLFTATQAQTTFGPDSEIVSGFRSYIATPETGLIFASADPVAAETFAITYLTHLYKTETPLMDKLRQKTLVFINAQIKELGTVPVTEQKSIKHAMELELGKPTEAIVWKNVPDELKEKLI